MTSQTAGAPPIRALVLERAFAFEVDDTKGGREQADVIARNGWSCSFDDCERRPAVAFNWMQKHGNPRAPGASYIRQAVCEECIPRARALLARVKGAA